ncbi:MAG: dTMP kinase [Actinobacteria bacterium]|nr:dTMP kinase [Actinomycetota bacterium]MCL5444528.1 dTMP kinase [Actinomycetota bacterium]
MAPERRGRLIAIEGIDGCGKSTQTALLAERIGAEATFEPGATELGASLRELLLQRSARISARSEALLMIADRAQHVEEVVRPALERGMWVVTDRFSASTLAYQGTGRGLQPSVLKELIDWATSGLWPDLVVLLDVPTSLARERLRGSRADRLELLGDGFQERVRRGFLAQAMNHPESWAVVDAARPAEVVASEVATIVQSRLGSLDADHRR